MQLSHADKMDILPLIRILDLNYLEDYFTDSIISNDCIEVTPHEFDIRVKNFTDDHLIKSYNTTLNTSSIIADVSTALSQPAVSIPDESPSICHRSIGSTKLNNKITNDQLLNNTSELCTSDQLLINPTELCSIALTNSDDSNNATLNTDSDKNHSCEVTAFTLNKKEFQYEDNVDCFIELTMKEEGSCELGTVSRSGAAHKRKYSIDLIASSEEYLVQSNFNRQQALSNGSHLSNKYKLQSNLFEPRNKNRRRSFTPASAKRFRCVGDASDGGRSRAGLVCGVCHVSFRRCSDLVRHVISLEHFSVSCPICDFQVCT